MSTLREALLEAGAWCVTSPPGGPSPLDWILVGIAAAIVSFAFIEAARHTFRPGERARTHIKWRILDDEDRP
jgi:hypothetical protein